MSRKIVLFSPFFYPEIISTGKYNTHLVSALNKLGFSVEVVSSFPLYPEWKPKRTKKGIDRVRIYRGGLFPYSKIMIFRRIQLELWFMVHSIRHTILMPPKDIIISVFPPVIFFLGIKHFIPKNAKKIGIVHDIQGIMATVSKGIKALGLLKIIKYFEKRAFQSCDKIVFVSKSMAEAATASYKLEPEKVFFAYPFVNLDKTRKTSELANFFAKSKCHIVYSGAFGEKQCPRKLLEIFFEIVNKRKDTVCHIFSKGPLFEELKNSALYKNDNVLFHNLVPEKNLYELYLRSDVQIIPQEQGTSEGAIPSKLPNIIAAGAPVFLIGDGNSDLADLVKKSGIGACSESWETDKVVNDLDVFIRKSYELSHEDRQRVVAQFIEDHFGFEKLLNLVTS